MRNASEPMPRRTAENHHRRSGVHAIEQSGVEYRPNDFEHSVRIDASGRVLAGHGRVQDMAALSAYVCRVSDLIGEFMGLGGLMSFEATLLRGSYLLYRDTTGHAVAVMPRPHVGLRRLRARLNL